MILTKRKIPILFCIDIEPDTRKLDRRPPLDWAGFEKSFEFFQKARRRLERVTGEPVHFSWFLRMDPQIKETYGSPDWAVTRYRPLLSELEAAGDEIGLHSHAWRWDESTHDWVADFGNPEWIDHCIRSAFDAYHKSMKRNCKSFRFGDHWMSERGFDLLESLGAQFDLTLEPGQTGPTLLADERSTGSFPNCRGMVQSPYQPRKNNFTKPGLILKRDLWVIPVSAGLPQATRGWLKRFNSPGNQQYVTLNLAFIRETFANIADRLLARLRKPFLAIVARTDISIVPSERTNLEANIEYLLSHPLAERFVCETPAEAMRRLRVGPIAWLRKP